MTAHPALPLPTLERARGNVALTVDRREGRNAIADLAQSGCGRLLFPKVGRSAPLEAVVINTGGGLAGGDRFDITMTVEKGAEALATTQACEKVYRSQGDTAILETRLRLADGASLFWLPQETILFDRSRLSRRLEVAMAQTARLLLVEAVLLGRRASGESLSEGYFRDSWRIRRGDRLVFAEELRLAGDLRSTMMGKATLAGGAAFATVCLVSPGAPGLVDEARQVITQMITDEAAEAAISTFDGLCVARLVAQDGARLRSTLIPLLRVLGGTVPRLWSL